MEVSNVLVVNKTDLVDEAQTQVSGRLCVCVREREREREKGGGCMHSTKIMCAHASPKTDTCMHTYNVLQSLTQILKRLNPAAIIMKASYGVVPVESILVRCWC